jgi:dipeptidyl aminopeptidase/acylaminoacyl peptidase
MKLATRLFLALILGAFPAFAADPPSIETFFRLPQYSLMRLSPDGARIAALAPVGQHQALVVMDLAAKKATPVTALDGQDVVWFRWLTSNRLIFSTGARGKRIDDYRPSETWAIDRDGSNPRRLSESNYNAVMAARHLRIVRFLPGESNDFIAQEMTYDSVGPHPGALVRVDSRSGRHTSIALGAPSGGQSEEWVVDEHGEARALVATDRNVQRVFYRDNADAPWRKLEERPAVSQAWMPLAVAPDGKTLIVSAYNGNDKQAITRYDPATGKFGEVMARHPQVDLDDLVMDEGKPVGVRYDADRGGTAMFDEALERVQETVDKTFPDTVNVLSWSRDRARFIVFSYSDKSPGAFYLLDAKSRKIEWLADVAPWIHPKEMASMKAVRYTARDGLELPAFVTLPREGTGKPLPMVVVVHGGPWISGDRWGYDPEAQFLASRGYAVLQPNFRGTTRYGWKHYSSSFKQWGLAMQDDIEDGVRWAIEQGIADPKRVAIYGASYGGYATMMGLAKTPDLYRCGIDYVGVTDLPLMLTATWSDFAYSDWITYSAPLIMGDVDKDAEQLRKTSPVNLAARIKMPVLLAYGAADVRVPIEHGTRMRSALDRAGVKYEWMVMEGEGHGFQDLENQKAFYGAMEKFLAGNMK